MKPIASERLKADDIRRAELKAKVTKEAKARALTAPQIAEKYKSEAAAASWKLTSLKSFVYDVRGKRRKKKKKKSKAAMLEQKRKIDHVQALLISPTAGLKDLGAALILLGRLPFESQQEVVSKFVGVDAELVLSPADAKKRVRQKYGERLEGKQARARSENPLKPIPRGHR